MFKATKVQVRQFYSLETRLQNAMRNILMAEVSRRLGDKPSKKDLASAAKTIRLAVERALETQPDNMGLYFRRALGQNTLTAGIVKRSRNEVLAEITEGMNKIPEAQIVVKVHGQLARNEKVEPTLVDQAREALLGLKTRQLEKAGISSRITQDIGLTPFEALITAFPLLGLNREDLRGMSWVTPEDGIRNVRYHVFKNNPGLEKEVKDLENALETGRYRLTNVYSLNITRLKIKKLVTVSNLNRWGLASFKNAPYFATAEAVADKCFAFINHPVFDQFIKMERPQNLEGFKSTFYSAWKIGQYYQRIKRQLSDEQLQQYYDDLVVNAEATRSAIRQELLRIYKEFNGVINLDKVMLNSNWVRKYSVLVFYDLFGVSCADYLKTGFLDFLKSKSTRKTS